MTASPSPPTVESKPQRLAIIHFLGWMVGVAVVLAIYRLGAYLLNPGVELEFSQRLMQLGFGLVYGTAISGLGLFVWRWRRGTGNAPTQPGHWLLVFGGLGLVIDVGIAAAVNASPILWGQRLGSLGYWNWSIHQIVGWLSAAGVAGIVLLKLRAAWWWRLAAWVVLVVSMANAGVAVIHVMGNQGWLWGSWPYEVHLAARLGGALLCFAVLALAEVCDRRRGLPRDWLHAAGILTALSLAGVDFAVQGYFAWLGWR